MPENIRTSEFDYTLPEELIAQYPLEARDRSRLLVLNREENSISHRIFNDLPSLLREGDRIVFNDTKVYPARLIGRKSTGASVEFLFTNRISDNLWRALVRPAKRLKVGARVIAGDEEFEIAAEEEDGFRLIRLVSQTVFTRITDFLEHSGVMPLPPYMRRKAEKGDSSSYQTVYAKKTGAVAAPTAGLHFTKHLLEELDRAGVQSSFVTLHVGIGTFRPVEEEDPREHTIHEEQFELSSDAAEQIWETKRNGGRVVAVGTTVVRVLESCADKAGRLVPQTGSTRLFIMPGYRFKMVDSLITNFHLPKSTLLMLVSAFAGKEPILQAYKAAVDQRYRFFSYGDAMFIL